MSRHNRKPRYSQRSRNTNRPAVQSEFTRDFYQNGNMHTSVTSQNVNSGYSWSQLMPSMPSMPSMPWSKSKQQKQISRQLDKSTQKTVFVELFRQNTKIVLENFDHFIKSWIEYQTKPNPETKKDIQLKLSLMNESIKVYQIFAKHVIDESEKEYNEFGGKELSKKELLMALKQFDEYFLKIKHNDDTENSIISKRMEIFYQYISSMLKNPHGAPDLPFIDLNANFNSKSLEKGIGNLMIASHQRQDQVKDIEQNTSYYVQKQQQEEEKYLSSSSSNSGKQQQPHSQRSFDIMELYPEVDKKQVKQLPSYSERRKQAKKELWTNMQLKVGQKLKVRPKGDAPGSYWEEARISGQTSTDPNKIAVRTQYGKLIEVIWDPQYCRLVGHEAKEFKKCLNKECPPPDLGGLSPMQEVTTMATTKKTKTTKTATITEDLKENEFDGWKDDGKMHGFTEKNRDGLSKSKYAQKKKQKSNQLQCGQIVEFKKNKSAKSWKKGRVSENTTNCSGVVNIIDERSGRDHLIPLNRDYIKIPDVDEDSEMTQDEGESTCDIQVGDEVYYRESPLEKEWLKKGTVIGFKSSKQVIISDNRHDKYDQKGRVCVFLDKNWIKKCDDQTSMEF